jgi:hypothetical protein
MNDDTQLPPALPVRQLARVRSRRKAMVELPMVKSATRITSSNSAEIAAG